MQVVVGALLLCALSSPHVDAVRIRVDAVSSANLGATVAPVDTTSYSSKADLLTITDQVEIPLMDKFFQYKCPEVASFMKDIDGATEVAINAMREAVAQDPLKPVKWPMLPNPALTDVMTMVGMLGMTVGTQHSYDDVTKLNGIITDLKQQWMELGSSEPFTTPEAPLNNTLRDKLIWNSAQVDKWVALLAGITEEQQKQNVLKLYDSSNEVVALVLKVKKVFNYHTEGNRFVVISVEDRRYPMLAEAKPAKKGPGLEVKKDTLLGAVVPAQDMPTVLATDTGITLPWPLAEGRAYEWYDVEEQAEAFQAFSGDVLGRARQMHAEDRWNKVEIKAAVKWREWHCQCSKHNFVVPAKKKPAQLNWEEFMNYWNCMHKQALPQAAAEEASPAVESEPTGACTQADREAMEEKGGGHEDESLPGIAAGCGATSWSFSGWKPDKFVGCLTEKIPLSPTCATCFSDAGNYGFQNCKMACMKSWCGNKCMSCNTNYNEAFMACTGIPVPPASEC